MIWVKTKRLRESEPAELPLRAHQDDAGLDLVISADTKVGVGEIVDVPCNIAVAIPGGYFGLIIGRSSTVRKRRLHVHPGVIDSGWRGELFACVTALDAPVDLRVGERVAQLLVLPTPVIAVQWGILPTGDRGESGFGSTGP